MNIIKYFTTAQSTVDLIKASSFIYYWSYVLLQVVCGRILIKSYKTNVNFTILEGRTFPVSINGGCLITIATVFLRNLKKYAAVASHLRKPQDKRGILLAGIR